MNDEFFILKKAIPEEICKLASIEYQIQESCCKIFFPSVDLSDLSPNSFARYSPLCFEALSVYIKPIVEETVKMELYPVYSYARIYYTNSRLDPHIDRRSSEVTVSACIEKDKKDWPIFIRTSDNVVHEVNLDEGDLVIYSGRKHEHWRDPFLGEKQIQCFMMYVDANGPDAWLKWDTRPSLGLPFEYAGSEIRREMEEVLRRDKLKGR